MNNEATEAKATTNWLTLEEAAKYMNMGRPTVYKLLRENGIGVLPESKTRKRVYQETM